eukprot:gene8546-1392_t
MPTKQDNVVMCRLAPLQEQVYARVIAMPDYQKLLHAEDPCDCGSGALTKECHPVDPDGILFQQRHPDGEACDRCLTGCIGFRALSHLAKISNHLELLKPDPALRSSGIEKDFARHALDYEGGGGGGVFVE